MRATVITVSDSSFAGQRPDLSGPQVRKMLEAAGFTVEQRLVPDDVEAITATLREAAQAVQLVVTTGGTGLAERDVTPEATRSVCTRLVPGLAERMRAEGAKKTPLAALSRGVCGILDRTLVINLPGSPIGAQESLETVLPLLPHALELLAGHTDHAGLNR
ncbi:MogA/MoaB family molybdenum cofactor biosynthesis protein [Terriglobus albidus]|uniref:MogA/MoaB family molybdenum cofactor biosynthesis protein n=1 Tax=Terriglobus albidus TaxID=1592106 RepID=UPI00295AEB6C|nr:MogA/MoaB family molybdenum cofactor biosynthesis protein [Terriglobus albidus]